MSKPKNRRGSRTDNRATVHTAVLDAKVRAVTRRQYEHLGFRGLHLNNIDRFGWRFWAVNADGLLQSPYTQTHYDAPVIGCRCPHGNTPPSPECSCGVYYVCNPFTFFRGLSELVKLGKANTDEIIATWGVALDGVDVDPSDEHWNGLRPNRTGHYRILGMIAGNSVTDVAGLREQYELPLLDIERSFDIETAVNMEAIWDAVAPATFDRVVSAYADDRKSIGSEPIYSNLGGRAVTAPPSGLSRKGRRRR